MKNKSIAKYNFSISKKQIENRLSQKMNPILVETLIKLKKTNPEVAKYLARPIKKGIEKNLSEINGEKESVLIPGKVLGTGDLNKKIKIVAWKFSGSAIEKIKKSGSEAILIRDEMRKNPELKNLKILK